MAIQCASGTVSLETRVTVIAGSRAKYLVGGRGPCVVFLHGWGLTHRTYARSLQALAAAGMRVVAPTMPGFGGSATLLRKHPGKVTLKEYGVWVADFISELAARGEITAPVTLVGHSFGGGVAIRTAHDHPDLVARLVLVNSIGGSAWTDDRGIARSLVERPLWDWGLHLSADLFPVRQMTRILPVIIRDAVPNLVKNLRSVWQAGLMARTADLTSELEELKRRRLPVVIVWSSRDNVIPAATTASMRAAAGSREAVTVDGSHGWLLYDPRGFGEIITNVLGAAEAALPEFEPTGDAA
nr:alpha/beta hydrolase [Hoyosella altamirensis]